MFWEDEWSESSSQGRALTPLAPTAALIQKVALPL